jgi:hypothetical protein
MSSASAWSRTSQNAKLKAASICGNANLSKLDNWLIGPLLSTLLQVYIPGTCVPLNVPVMAARNTVAAEWD